MLARLVLEGQAPQLLDARQYLLGRGDGCDVLLPAHDARVSRRHALIEPIGEGWRIVDLNSSNGVFLNGARVAGSHDLHDGDRILLGATALRFVAAEVEAEPPTQLFPIAPAPVVASPRPKPAPSAPQTWPPISAPAAPIVQNAHSTPFDNWIDDESGDNADVVDVDSVTAVTDTPIEVGKGGADAHFQSEYSDPIGSGRQPPPTAPSIILWSVAAVVALVMLLSLFLPWAQVSFFFVSGQLSYAGLCRAVWQLLQQTPRALESEPRLLYLGAPALATFLVIGGAVSGWFRLLVAGAHRDTNYRGAMACVSLLAGGGLGLFSGLLVYSYLTNAGGANFTGVLGGGFYLFLLASLGAAALGGAGLALAPVWKSKGGAA